MPSRFEATAGDFLGPTVYGVVVQQTNKVTDVTIDVEAGRIATSPVDGIDSQGPFSFWVNNDRVSANDVVLANIVYSSFSQFDAWAVQIVDIQKGKFRVILTKMRGRFRDGIICWLNFCIFKGSTS